jgi:hypothetical protein
MTGRVDKENNQPREEVDSVRSSTNQDIVNKWMPKPMLESV